MGEVKQKEMMIISRPNIRDAMDWINMNRIPQSAIINVLFANGQYHIVYYD